MTRKEYNGGKWTRGRFQGFITSSLRAAARKWEPKWQVLGYALQGRYLNPKTGKMANHYLCANCVEIFPLKDIQVDHKRAVVGKEGFVDWDTYIERLFCEADNLQVLCTACHKIKSAEETKERAATRRKDKK